MKQHEESVRDRVAGTVLKEDMKVWACPEKMHSLEINGEEKSSGQKDNPGSPGKNGR